MKKYSREEIVANREKWLKALESGRYKQGVAGGLLDSGYSYREEHGVMGYCCLGVWVRCNRVSYDDIRAMEGDYDGGLSPEFKNMLGMTDEQENKAMNLNDGTNETPRESFKQIAAYFRNTWRQPRDDGR